MESLLGVPVLYLFLLVSQLISADSLVGGQGKADESSIVVSSHENSSANREAEQHQAILRLLLLATQGNGRVPGSQFRAVAHNWGIPYRPVRRIGSEFLGKRSEYPVYFEDDGNVDKRRMGSEFLGKRRMGSEFLGKRRMGSEFLGKRGMGSEFLGKRRMGSEFLGKRGMGSEFLGKRGMGSEFLGKRRMGSEFLGKRRMGSEFLGKRDYDYPAVTEGGDVEYPMYFHNSMDNYIDAGDNYAMEKRALGSEFLGKRKPEGAYDYNWKRGRLGSEFLGKRSMEGSLDTATTADTNNSTEEH